MFVFLLIVTIFAFLLLVLVSAMQPHSAPLSTYELKRRVEAGNEAAKKQLHTQKLFVDVVSILRVKTAFLLAITVVLLVVTFGWALGLIVSLLVVLEYNAFARPRFVRSLAARLYSQLEPLLLKIAASGFMKLIRSYVGSPADIHLGSRQELEHLINASEGVLSVDEKKLVVHSLAFSDKKVSTIMTPVADIITVKKTEFLGPLTLDDLHKTGHKQLPVTSQDINHIVGILHLEGLLALDIKRSVTAEKAMDDNVVYVKANEMLPKALAAFLRARQHLLIVIDDSHHTVGLLTLDDIIEALIGRKIVEDSDNDE